MVKVEDNYGKPVRIGDSSSEFGAHGVKLTAYDRETTQWYTVYLAYDRIEEVRPVTSYTADSPNYLILTKSGKEYLTLSMLDGQTLAARITGIASEHELARALTETKKTDPQPPLLPFAGQILSMYMVLLALAYTVAQNDYLKGGAYALIAIAAQLFVISESVYHQSYKRNKKG